MGKSGLEKALPDPSRPWRIRADVRDLVRLFYDAIGGQPRYAHHPPEIKDVCCGLKASLMHRRFTTAGELCHYVETLDWWSR